MTSFNFNCLQIQSCWRLGPQHINLGGQRAHFGPYQHKWHKIHWIVYVNGTCLFSCDNKALYIKSKFSFFLAVSISNRFFPQQMDPFLLKSSCLWVVKQTCFCEKHYAKKKLLPYQMKLYSSCKKCHRQNDLEKSKHNVTHKLILIE